MNKQMTFQQVLAQVDQLDTQVRLKLPASRASIQRQVEQIEAAEQQLQAVKIQVLQQSRKVWLTPCQYDYLPLVCRIEKMLQSVRSFKHLAEEFPLDPEGTTSLLQEMNSKVSLHP